MKWPWNRKKRPPQPGREEARQAREHAEEALDQARKDTPEVLRIARALKAQREENHFSPMILKALREER